MSSIQKTLTCTKSAIEILEKGVKYVNGVKQVHGNQGTHLFLVFPSLNLNR